MTICKWKWCKSDTFFSRSVSDGTVFFKRRLTLKWPRYFYSRWCPRGVPRDPTVENHFPKGILQWNFHHICIKINIYIKKFENVVPFQNGGQITDFYFASFWFWPKFEKKKNTFPKECFNEIWLKVGEQ